MTLAYTNASTGRDESVNGSGGSVNVRLPAAATHHHAISAATTNATSVKAAAGVVSNVTVSNNGAGVAYFKLYDKASAPTVGTDVPVRTVLVPANGTVVVDTAAGLSLASGIAYAITGGMAVADATAVAAAQVAVGISYA